MSVVYCVTKELLEYLFNFDPETGIFIWKKRKGVKANSVAGALVKGYRRICVGGKVGFPDKSSSLPRKFYNAHALVWLWTYGEFPDPLLDIDHIDGNRDNNRVSNLRQLTRSENMCNVVKAQSNNTSGLRGAHFHPTSGMWQAAISVNGVGRRLGYFKTPQEAHEVYMKAKQEIHPSCNFERSN